MIPSCEVCETEIDDPGQDFFDRGHVCDSCWDEWEKENRQQMNDYYNSRL